MDSTITLDVRRLSGNVTALEPKIERAIAATLRYHSTRAIAYARQNAPWTDRTTNARNGLFARVENHGPQHSLIIGHGVPYGIWLETRFSGRFAIIKPTVDHEGPLVLATARQLIGRIMSD